jgi:hypothetical protein
MSRIITNKISPKSGDTITFTGGITGSSINFTGNVSIGGTLSYEDVADIDSVGVITARNGIIVESSGIDAVGVITATSFIGDASELTGISAGGVANFVASGTIPNGQTVIIKDDGTVGIVTLTESGPSAGTPAIYESGTVLNNSAVYVGNSKILVAYRSTGNSNYGTAVVGTVVGTGITFGSAVVFKAGALYYITTTYDSINDKVVIAYRDQSNSDKGECAVGTVVGTGVTFPSTPVLFDNTPAAYMSSTYDSTNGKVVIAFQNEQNSYYGAAIVGEVNSGVTGAAITFGTKEVFNSDITYYTSSTYDSANSKVVIAYSNTNQYKGTAKVGTVTGLGITFGTASVFLPNSDTATLYPKSSVYDPDTGKVIVSWKTGGGSLGAVLGTVDTSDNSIGFSTYFYFYSGIPNFLAYDVSLAYDTINNKVIASYKDNGNLNYVTAKVGTITGSGAGIGLTFGSATVCAATHGDEPECAYDPDTGKVVIAYYDQTSPAFNGKAVVFGATSQTTNLTSSNYIGLAAEAISNGATGKVNILGGVNSGQTGLTTAQTYYVQPNGTLATSAGNPSVVGGVSLSTTKLIVKE